MPQRAGHLYVRPHATHHAQPVAVHPAHHAERDLCEKVQAQSGEVVLEVWTPQTYPFEDIAGERVRLEADYAVRTGRLTNGLFTSGSNYFGFVRDGEVEIELDGSWTS